MTPEKLWYAVELQARDGRLVFNPSVQRYPFRGKLAYPNIYFRFRT